MPASNPRKKIILAADHAGFALKEAVKKFLQEKDYEIEDVGAREYKEDDDYPEYMAKAAVKIAYDQTGKTKAVIFGKSGQGEAMVANRFPGVRAAVWYGGPEESSGKILRLSREHNDANMLAVGADFVNENQTEEAVESWLNTAFSGEERHFRRIEEMDSLE
ncbi:RpiB/LacA/LacB family sugar-phosphate isomerase [Patescibacteria group bacterium]|nr:RpiB/LacA/LacB family sugar-phosphate isomerase [Patescibacteria group bacterium]MDE1946301.1 RpiB/LacA/LacB family sugar-phosphate isomerase [Patescibacteria group bacterium]MDE2010753.1 RpiB/LacA/LacB family sugar-phosphate isomerase [Patescibacteria group bacterium]MDE2232637.1 RpiB/LacA/LacB family sugar-phosphate isomerase [Patescibacteria group bacterium]